jgi:hypothetical protein
MDPIGQVEFGIVFHRCNQEFQIPSPILDRLNIAVFLQDHHEENLFTK